LDPSFGFNPLLHCDEQLLMQDEAQLRQTGTQTHLLQFKPQLGLPSLGFILLLHSDEQLLV
jgi:hypothetical protein